VTAQRYSRVPSLPSLPSLPSGSVPGGDAEPREGGDAAVFVAAALAGHMIMKSFRVVKG
jgi:hypothetical protein